MVFPPKKKDYIIKKNIDSKNINNIIEESIKCFSSFVLIYKNNNKILEINNKKDNKLIESSSVTKSICSFAIMFLIQDKIIDSVNDLICKYITAWKYGKKKDITIKHILTHTSGLDTYWSYDNFMWPEGKLEYFLNKTGKKPNVEEISISIDKIRDNNSEWYYNDTASQLIPTLVKKLTGIHIDKYLNIKLFKPLDIKFKWNKDDDGNPYGPNGLNISTDGLCKIGLLILNNGVLNKKIILDKHLIFEMVRQRITDKEIMNSSSHFAQSKYTGYGYGYLWWKYKNTIIASGFLGQYLIINPKKNIIASRLIEPKWNNKLFVKETNSDLLHFNNFIELINKL